MVVLRAQLYEYCISAFPCLANEAIFHYLRMRMAARDAAMVVIRCWGLLASHALRL